MLDLALGLCDIDSELRAHGMREGQRGWASRRFCLVLESSKHSSTSFQIHLLFSSSHVLFKLSFGKYLSIKFYLCTAMVNCKGPPQNL